jgi:hypothetical protein
VESVNTTALAANGSEKKMVEHANASSNDVAMSNRTDPNAPQSIPIATARTNHNKNTTGTTTNATITANFNKTNVQNSRQRLVMFRSNPNEEDWTTVPIVAFQKLGYSESEIQTLLPTVLALIINSAIARPRTGIPGRWTTTAATATATGETAANASSLVRIVQQRPGPMQEDLLAQGNSKQRQPPLKTEPISFDPKQEQSRSTRDNPMVPPRKSRIEVEHEEKDFLASQSLKPKISDPTFRATATTIPRTNVTTSVSDRSAPNVPLREDRIRSRTVLSERQRLSMEERRLRDEKVDRSIPASRQRRSTTMPEENPASSTQKRIYSVRPTRGATADREKKTFAAATAELEDPPSVGWFWPDLKTFRNLLRNEAGMRMRILGPDWVDSVKEESDWRLDLYRNWLWTLSRGWGEPMVQSRSDRMRKQREAEISKAMQEEQRRRRRKRPER